MAGWGGDQGAKSKDGFQEVQREGQLRWEDEDRPRVRIWKPEHLSGVEWGSEEKSALRDSGVTSTDVIRTVCHSGEHMSKEETPVFSQERGHKQRKWKSSVQENGQH